MKIVLQKYIANSGYCSRRKAEDLIRSGRVKVGASRAELGMRVDGDDEVQVNGKKIGDSEHSKKIYLVINKPAGYVCSNRKFPGEKNIFDLLNPLSGGVPRSHRGGVGNPPSSDFKNFRLSTSKLNIAGRLDKESRGLLLLTNDGELVNRLTHPRFEHEKKYLVWTDAREEYSLKNFYKRMRYGVDIGDGDGMVKTKSVDRLKDGSFEIVLTEGKKRQIRRMFEKLGLEVTDLLRTDLGPLTLGKLREGEWRELTKSEVDKLTAHNA